MRDLALKAKTLLIVRLQGFIRFVIVSCDPAGIRTQDHYIKSVMLYQLSYGIVFFKADAKIESFLFKPTAKFIFSKFYSQSCSMVDFQVVPHLGFLCLQVKFVVLV